MIIVVANSKGGVGKSTLAVHLAAWLTEQQFPVCSGVKQILAQQLVKLVCCVAWGVLPRSASVRS
jgi:MinD superfamily P-loop ATPase